MGMMSLGSVGMAGMAVNEMNTMTGKIQKLETMIKSKADESEVRSLQDTLTSRVGKFIFLQNLKGFQCYQLFGNAEFNFCDVYQIFGQIVLKNCPIWD